MKVLLLGLTGSGKSTIAPKIAKEFNLQLVEADNEVIKQNGGIWPKEEVIIGKYFDISNTETVKRNNIIYVISWMNKETVINFKDNGFTIIELHADINELIRRKSQRDNIAIDEIERFKENYGGYYEVINDNKIRNLLAASIDTTNMSIETAIILCCGALRAQSFTPNKETLDKLEFISKLQKLSENNGFKLWHCGSWAISAMLERFFKDLNDIDIVVQTEGNKQRLSEIVESLGFKFKADHPWGPREYTNGKYEIEFGSAEDNRNMYFESNFSEQNYGVLNGIKLYIADPVKILTSRHEMIKAGFKQLDETQKFIIAIIENFVSRKDKK